MTKRGLAFGGILAILSGVGIYNNIYATETGTTKFSVDVNNAVLELTVPSNPAVIDLNPTMTNASFGSTSINIHVATNNQTGYTLTMTPTNNQTATSLIRTELIEDEQNYREIETLELTDPISTGYTEQTFTANSWGYKITGDNYYGIDQNNTTVSHPAWVTDAPTNGTDHNLTLAAKVDADTVSGTYETTLNFRAVTNALIAKDTVTFNGNGADGGDMSGDSFVVDSGNSATLPTNAYAKSGYAFLGWNTAQNGSGMSYADGGTYTAISTNYSHNITLYAMWADTSSELFDILHPSGTVDPGITISRAYEIAYTNAGKGMWERDEGDRDNDGDTSEYYQVQDGVYHNYDVRWDMQGMTPEICNSVTVMHDDYQAIDVRDWKLYHITKLLDNHCWMTQNLDLDLSTEKTLTHYDTDLGWTENNLSATWLPNRNTTTRINGQRVTPWPYSNYESQSFDYGNKYIFSYSTNNDTLYDSFEQCIESYSVTECEHRHVGNYYQWLAAIAQDNYDSYSNAPNSVCPAGWRLPTSDNGYHLEYNDFYILNRNYSNYSSSPIYITGAGEIEAKSGQSIYGYLYTSYAKLWTNSPYHGNYSNSIHAFYHDGTVNENHFSALTGKGNNAGYSIRCLAR